MLEIRNMVWANDKIGADVTDQERATLTVDDASEQLGTQAINLEVTELYSDQGNWPLIKLNWLGTETELADKLIEINYLQDASDMKYLLNFNESMQA